MTTATTLVLASTLATARTDVNTIIGEQKSEASRFADSSRKRTYSIAQCVLKAGRVLLAEGNEQDFAALLMQNQIKTRTGSNPWSYVLALIIPEDKTWANRAGALRALARHCTDDNAATSYIDTFSIQTIKKATVTPTAIAAAIGDSEAGRLDGLALLDRIENRRDGDPTDDDFLNTATAAETLDLNQTLVSDEKVKFVMVWAQVKDGKVVPMGVVANSQAAAKKEALSKGKELYTPKGASPATMSVTYTPEVLIAPPGSAEVVTQ